MKALNNIEIFLEVAKHKSFAKAARNLGITGPAVSKQVMSLEEELGVKLFNRTTRMVTLTHEGGIFCERARVAMEELRDAAALLQEGRALPAGSLKINAPLSFGQLHLLPIISGFAKKYPDVVVEMSMEDRMVDIMAEGFDMVIRVGAMTDSSLICKHLANAPLLMVASPEYLKTNKPPVKPDNLKKHRIIAYTQQGGASEWKMKDKHGKVASYRSEGHFRANTADMMLQATLDGLGIVVLPKFCVSTHLEARQLVRVMPDWEITPLREVTALMPPNRYRSAKVKLFLEYLTQACKAMPF